MLQSLLEIDKELLLWINSMHSPVADSVMVFVTGKFTWIPLYAFWIGYIIYKLRIKAIAVILSIALVVTLADRISSGICKPTFERLRPCHEPELAEKLHLANGCGGQFGFVSSHAANSIGVAIFLSLIFGAYTWFGGTIWLWAISVSYSRIYLAAHYPGDILGGAIVGALAAYFCIFVLKRYYPVVFEK